MLRKIASILCHELANSIFRKIRIYPYWGYHTLEFKITTSIGEYVLKTMPAANRTNAQAINFPLIKITMFLTSCKKEKVNAFR